MIPTDIDSIDGLELAEVPSTEEKRILIEMVYSSTLDEFKREEMITSINNCLSYRLYEQMQYQLEDLQTPLDQLNSFNQTDIKNHLKKFVR